MLMNNTAFYIHPLLIILIPILSVAQQPEESRTISLVGTAEKTISADRAVFHYTVEGLGSTLEAAVEEASKRASDINVKLFEKGLPESSVETFQFQSSENTEGKAFLTSKRDFKAEVKVQVTVDTLDLLSSILGEVSQSPIQKLSNLQYKLQNPRQHYEQLRLEALSDAQHQAELYTKHLNISLGPVLKIDINSNREYSQPRTSYQESVTVMAAQRASGVRSKSLQPQQFTLSQSIHVMYRIQ